MGEEAFYTHAVQEYRENSRFPTLSRYRDLISFLQNVFKDNLITNEELRVVTQVERDILLEYELAADICSKLPSFSPRKTAAERLLSHIYRCYIVMNFAKERAKMQNLTQNETPHNQIKIKNPKDKILTLKVNPIQAELLSEVETQRQRIVADLPRIKKDLEKLPTDEKNKYEQKINAALDYLEQVNAGNLNVIDVNRLLGLEQRLKEDVEHIYE